MIDKLKKAENDITDEKLGAILDSISSRDTLIRLVETSRRYFGWYTKHLPRVYEYPWIITHLPILRNKNILDIGAGVSPLPLYLAEEEAKICTVDNSKNVHNLEEDSLNWNEWGFFDYAILNHNIKSTNKDILDIQFEDKFFDYIYSVSVIEHMTSSTRNQLWSKIKKWIKNEGLLLLTVDLIPDTEKLWNYCEGLTVEPLEQHGNLDDLKSEIISNGFALKKCEFQRRISDTRVDVGFLLFVKN